MDKALSGDLSCPCDRSCFNTYQSSKQLRHKNFEITVCFICLSSPDNGKVDDESRGPKKLKTADLHKPGFVFASA